MGTSSSIRRRAFHASSRGRRGERGTSITEFALTLPAVILMWCLTIDGGNVFLGKQRAAAALESAIVAAERTNFDPDKALENACNNLIGTNAVKGGLTLATCQGSVVTVTDPVDDLEGGKKFSLTASFNVPAILPITVPSFGGQKFVLASGYPISITKTGRVNSVLLNTQVP